MEEMQMNAKAYYHASPESVKQSANQFFDEMDSNKNERVKLFEYLAFMKRRGYTEMSNTYFFNLLDVGQKGYLEFWDVINLYYIVMSGRPFCDGCGYFIMGTFFTCVKCFRYSKFPATSPTFNLCSHCFRRQNYCHNHKQFLDNFLLLELSRVGSNFNEEKNGEYHTAQSGASNPGISLTQSAETETTSIRPRRAAKNNQPCETAQSGASNPGISLTQSAETETTSIRPRRASKNNQPCETAQSGASNPGISLTQSAETETTSIRPRRAAKNNQPYETPSASNLGISSSWSAEIKPSNSKAIVVATNPQRNQAMLDKALKLIQIAAAVGNFLVTAQFCTIM